MRTIREYDAYNELVAAGYEWGEPCTYREIAAIIVFLVGAAASAAGLILLKSTWLGLPIAGFGLFMLVWAYELYLDRFRPRSLIFTPFGTMNMPQRVPGFWWPRYEIKGHHEDAVAISVVQDESDDGNGKDHKAAIYFRSGNIVRVSGPVHPDDAHKIAVQLTTALEAVREAAVRIGVA